MADATPVLNLHDVRYRWSGRASFGLYVPDFRLLRGETVLLLGESGSGKSTLLSLICGTVMAQSGTVSVSGTNIETLSTGGRDRFRVEEIGIIFQQFNLLPYATVLDNILLPLRFAPTRRGRVTSPRAAAIDLCLELGLPRELMNERAGTLSVGQQQRVAAARALIGTPPLVIADEPTSALDAATQTVFIDHLLSQSRAHATTVLMVSHDARLAPQFDRVVHMADIAETERGAA